MKKQKVHLKKLSLQKKTIANMETVQGGIKETQIAVICQTLLNTTLIATTVNTTINLPPIISKDYKTCITDCIC